jgi:hypothetical protein
MKHNFLLLPAFAALLSLSSCMTPPQPYAKTIEMEPGKGGVIMIHPSEDPIAHQKAEAMMQSNCSGKKVQILKEGETKIGTASSGDTQNNTRQSGFLDQLAGIGNKSESHTNSATTDITEWRITYTCN